MTRCASCFQNSCPEAPDITINNTIVQIEQGHFLPVFEPVVFNAQKVATLAYTPYADSCVQLYMNGTLLNQGYDYTIYGKQLTENTPHEADAVFLASYWRLSNEATVSMVSGFVSAIADGVAEPTGWLLLNGVTTVGPASSGADKAAAAYEDLYLAAWGLLAVADRPVGTTGAAATDWAAGLVITLPNVQSTFYQGGNLVTMRGVIKI